MTTLTRASTEWSTRPADERFASLEALHAHCQHSRDAARTSHVRPGSLRIGTATVDADGTARLTDDRAIGTEPVLIGQTGAVARMSHHAFGQVARLADAPASYLRTLPADLAAKNLSHGLMARARESGDEPLSLLFRQNGGLQLRAALTDSYTRIWNADVTSRLGQFVTHYPEWQPAPAAFDGSRGLYAGDADMFAFLVDNDRRIFESLPGGGLSRGFFVWNSEVGAASFGIMKFCYNYICGNHMVWGASNVTEIRLRHVGTADARAWATLAGEIRRYADSSASDSEAQISAARRFQIAASKDEVLDRLFGLKSVGVSRKVLAESYAAAERHVDWYGSPRTAWGMASGMTEHSQTLPNASDRTALDRAAGRVMAMAF